MTCRPLSTLIQVLLGLLIATGVASQAPASEFTFGTYLPTLTPCYSTNVNKKIVTLGPISETVGFTPMATVIRYIRVWSDNLVPFYANVLTGGVGTAVATAVQVSSVHGGRLQVNIQAYCV